MNRRAHNGKPPRLMSAALGLARRGWFVFPLRPKDKRPLPRFTHWEQRATRDPDRIYQWWSAAAYNIGVATGPSKLLVIDCDSAGQEAPPPRWRDAHSGFDVLTLLAKEAQQRVPATLSVRTPSGGTHLYFHAPNDTHLRNTVGSLGWHIDTRGVGGYVVGPRSVRSDGWYTIIQPAPIAPLPGWLVAALTPTTQSAPLPRHLTDRHRSRYLQAILAGETEGIVNATPGTRNNALNRAAFIFGQLIGGGALSEATAIDALRRAAGRHVGRAGFTQAEMTRTIMSGLRAGKQYPRSIR